MVSTLKQEAREAQRLLANVPDEYIFWSHTGHILHNMRELKEELETMSDEGYAYHANMEKNDFFNWVRDIIKDNKLASDLLRAPNRAQAAKIVASRISTLSRK